MSHVDDGTLHAYLDGELSPAEAQGVDAHLAQCPACRGRLEEERALITRAGELLALAAPPDRELPPFRAGDIKPPSRLWWQVRLPLAWAATVALALGIGNYLGREVEPVPQAQTASDTQPELNVHQAPVSSAPVSSDLAKRESRVKVRGAARTPPAAPAPAARQEADGFVQERKAPVAALRDTPLSAVTPASAPQPGIAIFVDGRSVPKGSPISIDSARVLLGAEPRAVPGAPVRAIYRAREIGYSAVVIVEQALDSSTVIEVTNGRRSSVALDEIVVTGAGAMAARPDSVGVAERARVGRTRVADSMAPAPAAKASARPLRQLGDLEVRISGPLPSDSLQKLLQLVQPVKP
jgi:anti-sigma factor RsiW